MSVRLGMVNRCLTGGCRLKINHREHRGATEKILNFLATSNLLTNQTGPSVISRFFSVYSSVNLCGLCVLKINIHNKSKNSPRKPSAVAIDAPTKDCSYLFTRILSGAMINVTTASILSFVSLSTLFPLREPLKEQFFLGLIRCLNDDLHGIPRSRFPTLRQ